MYKRQIYLTLIVKIVLTILAAIRHKEKDTAGQNRGVLLAITAILLLANLPNAQTVADLSSGLIKGKGLRSLNRSRRYTLKGKRFLNIFLPIAFYILILEILTLLVCIVTFAPLSNAASNIFIFAIASVSYTHLDVYKRQTQYSFIKSILLFYKIMQFK